MTLVQAITDLIRVAFTQAPYTSASPNKTNVFIDNGSLQNLQVGGFEEELEKVIKEEIQKVTGSLKEQIEKDPELAKELLNAAQVGTNPLDFIRQYAKRLIPILMPLLIAAGLAEIIINTMLSPGGLFDRRLRRMITVEVNGLLDKQTQKNFSIGIRQLTIQSRAGFRNIQGIGSEDSLRQIREGTGAGLRKSALDYIDFTKGVREIRE